MVIEIVDVEAPKYLKKAFEELEILGRMLTPPDHCIVKIN